LDQGKHFAQATAADLNSHPPPGSILQFQGRLAPPWHAQGRQLHELRPGCLRSLQFTTVGAIGFADISKEWMSAAASVQSMTQRLSQSLGVAVGAYALELSSRLQGHATIVAADFWPAFLVVALISVCSVFYNLALPKDAGAELSGRAGEKKDTTVP